MSAENATSVLQLLAFPAEILTIEPMLPYILEESKRSAILDLFQQGKRRCEIVRLLNVPRQTVSDAICRFKELEMMVSVQEEDENAL
ncbi:hypothetical protein TNCV_3255981 [Trichonephila clavipes]|nr:hypothetical protein TNCV_3255981 [Trichonephila clavipes]